MKPVDPTGFLKDDLQQKALNERLQINENCNG
jgi:hypothetical protein